MQLLANSIFVLNIKKINKLDNTLSLTCAVITGIIIPYRISGSYKMGV